MTPLATTMDTLLPPLAPWWRRPRTLLLALLLLAVATTALLAAWQQPVWLAPARTLAADRVMLATVTAGRFDDVIPLRGVAAPLQTVFLDAVEGGRVDKRLVDDGALVQPGQALAVLTNSSLQLELLRSEAEVTSQLNGQRALELQLERNRIEHERRIAELRWQMQRSADKARRDAELARQGFLAEAALADGQAELAHLQQQLQIAQAAQRSDEALQARQLAQLRASAAQLQSGLTLARANLDALVVRAPMAGRLTGFELQVGQSLARGQRLGQIDSTQLGRMLVQIDEFHLPRIALGQAAEMELDGRRHALRVTRLNPQVRAGQFEAELQFDGAPPSTLRRGQTLQARLALGAPRSALLLPAGAFLADSGGAFVFVAEGSSAERRPVQLGRRNVQSVEVLAGLREGEQVLVSSYAGLTELQRLRLPR